MSRSPAYTTQNRKDALAMMLSLVGEARFNEPLFDPAESHFAKIDPTTWDKLCQRKEIKPLRHDYELTAHGWREALRIAGRFCDGETKNKLGSMCKFFKSKCESGGGRHPTITTVADTAKASDCSEAEIYNFIDAELLRYCLGKLGCKWAPDGQGEGIIEIPSGFDLPN